MQNKEEKNSLRKIFTQKLMFETKFDLPNLTQFGGCLCTVFARYSAKRYTTGEEIRVNSRLILSGDFENTIFLLNSENTFAAVRSCPRHCRSCVSETINSGLAVCARVDVIVLKRL